MIAAAHHTMMSGGKIPTMYNFIALKVCAVRVMRNYTSLSSYQQLNDGYVQLSEIKFLTNDNARYVYPQDTTFTSHFMFNGNKYYTDAAVRYTSSDGRNWFLALDNNTSTKVCNPYPPGISSNGYHKEIRSYQDDSVVFNLSTGITDAQRQDTFGHKRFVPVSVTFDFSSNPIDIKEYTKWQFINGNDNATQTGRTWVEGEILGSVDKNTWYRLDVFNDISIPNTNLAVAYTGNLVPRKGDLWSDLDLSTRDWTNGITVDNV